MGTSNPESRAPATISEDHFTRLARVPRATRQGWATAGMVGPQHSPYELAALYEVVAYGHLKQSLAGAADVAWAQLRTDLRTMAGESAELVVDLHVLAAAWVTSNETVVRMARSGHDVRLIDLKPLLAEAKTGFELAAAASRLARPADQLAPRRQSTRKRA